MSFRLSIDCFKKDERLKKVFDTDQKITEIEKKIFQKSANDPQKYRNIIYDIITDILKGQNFKDVLRSLEQEKYVWNHPEFSEIIFKQREQDGHRPCKKPRPPTKRLRASGWHRRKSVHQTGPTSGGSVVDIAISHHSQAAAVAAARCANQAKVRASPSVTDVWACQEQAARSRAGSMTERFCSPGLASACTTSTLSAEASSRVLANWFTLVSWPWPTLKPPTRRCCRASALALTTSSIYT